MDIFPVFFRMDDAAVAVFGGGETARRKVRLLTKTPAVIHVLADAPDGAFQAEFGDAVNWHPLRTAAKILPDCRFAIIAEEGEGAALAAFQLARAAGVPVNSVDRKAWCDFTVPSIMDRGRVVGAIATGGAAPVLAKQLRAAMEEATPQGVTALSDWAAGLRAAVKIACDGEAARRRVWEGVFAGAAAERFLAGDTAGAAQAVDRLIRGEAETPAPKPVTIIEWPGVGSDLLSVLALRRLQGADMAWIEGEMPAGLGDVLRRDADREVWTGATDAIAAVSAAAMAGRAVVLVAGSRAGAVAARQGLEGVGAGCETIWAAALE